MHTTAKTRRPMFTPSAQYRRDVLIYPTMNDHLQELSTGLLLAQQLGQVLSNDGPAQAKALGTLEVLEHIIIHLHPYDIKMARKVSRTFNQLIVSSPAIRKAMVMLPIQAESKFIQWQQTQQRGRASLPRYDVPADMLFHPVIQNVVQDDSTGERSFSIVQMREESLKITKLTRLFQKALTVYTRPTFAKCQNHFATRLPSCQNDFATQPRCRVVGMRMRCQLGGDEHSTECVIYRKKGFESETSLLWHLLRPAGGFQECGDRGEDRVVVYGSGGSLWADKLKAEWEALA
ncbi:uncharacterized protein LTR77_003508 [Saxophila tyrrhenica]|uniref:F-box domain-containing protein n=1 Tax=Saxophila tyrrhenica TaxID=1690608 RepID=A0AAV9PH97_9PEZI|nr:hypothetical protein LTR77_003508 [Saxophila tyrrhenica]